MNIRFNLINFCSSSKTYKSGNNTVVEQLSDGGTLLKRIEYDEFNRDIDAKHFDEKGNLKSHQHKQYYEQANKSGFIETYKDKNQEYTRNSYTVIENGLKRTVDDYESKTKSYINEFFHDLSGNLVKIISDGKVIELKK